MAFTEDFIEKFKNLKFTIPFIPKTFQVKELKRKIKDIEFSHPEEYLNFLTTEKDFWKKHEENEYFKTYVNAYSSAISNLTNASTSGLNYATYLSSSKNNLEKVPNSKSILAKELLKYKDMPFKFFEGFIAGINNSERTFTSMSKYYALGLYKSFQYIEIIRKIDDMLPDQQESFENTQVAFINTADEYIKKYNELFALKEKEFKDMDARITDELNNQKESHEQFLKEKKQTMQDLEKLYAENLRLKKPAEYWQKMSQDYEKKQ